LDRSKGTNLSEETEGSSTSHTKILERQLSVEVSSFSRHVDKDKDVKDRYKEIKMINEKLKAKTYA